VNGVTGCQRCHQTDQWKMTAFDHSRTTFPLEGKHAGVACAKCHKPVTVDQDTFILYKLKDTRCEACH
jgi:nitrate/TMAO reductase-like tetraheme cytochrome c subunit